MTKHSRLSPSSTKRWMDCPGSIHMIEKHAPERRATRYAAEGTVAHEVCEKSLLRDKQPADYIGDTIKADGFSFTVTEEMAEACKEYTDFIRSITLTNDTTEMLIEVKLPLSSLGVPGLDGGTADCLLINREGKWIHVLDYKHGAGVPVEVLDNPQAMSYALGALLQLEVGELEDWTATMSIIQPRTHHPEGTTRTWHTTSDHLLDWCEQQLLPAAKRATDPEAPINPTSAACRFCGAAGQCKQLYNRTQELAMQDFDTALDLPDPDSLTAEQKSNILDHASMIRSFIVAVENQVKLEVDKGSTDYNGRYKLVRKTTRRKFTSDAEEKLLHWLPEDKVHERKMLGLTAIEKNLKKELGVKETKEFMKEITIKPEGATVIAPESDRRKPVQPTMVSDFNQLDNT